MCFIIVKQKLCNTFAKIKLFVDYPFSKKPFIRGTAFIKFFVIILNFV